MISSLAKHLALQCAIGSVLFAGTPAPKDPPAVAISPTVDPWEITVSPYGWAAGLEGTTGIKGFTAQTDVPFTDILSNLDMTAMLNIEARKGRWGGWVDGLYLKMSAGTDPSGPLLDSVGLSIQQVIAEAAVFYRVLEGRRGYLDVYAGARYMSVSGDLSLDVSDSGVEQLSRNISDAVVGRVIDEVTSLASSAASETKTAVTSEITARVADGLAAVALRASEVQDKVSEAKSAVSAARTKAEATKAAAQLEAANRAAEISSSVSQKGATAQASIAQLQSIAAAHPEVIDIIRNSSKMQSALKTAVTAGVEQRAQEAGLEQKVAAARQAVANAEQLAATVETVAANAQQTVANAEQAAAAARTAAETSVNNARATLASAQAELDAARSNVSSRTKKAVEKAQKKLATAIEDALRDAIPDEISGSADWVDPFVGFRARYNFNDRFYAIAKADIGGFGVSSDLIWQAYGALGCHLTKSGKTTAELGYKYMAVDYTRGGFTYDVAMSGVMMSLGLKF